jgi:hypothetical protein
MFALFLALPITDLYFGLYYLNGDICDSSIVSIPLWLLVKGATKMFSSIIIIIYHVCQHKSLCANITGVIYIIFTLFLTIWLIFGGIIFIKDCYNLKPKELNTFIWISLVLETIFILGSKKSLDRY